MSSISQPDPGASTTAVAPTKLHDVFARATAGPDYWFVAVLFAASGFSSLVYQVVWTRLLVLVFGSTTIATSTVLAVFMGGLALGSYMASRVADRVQRPLFWYGVLEGIIGLWALVTPLMFDSAIPLYRAIWQGAHPVYLLASMIRFFVAAGILLIPTTCMGATLPLLSKHLTTSVKFAAAQVGTLYAVNTVGAVGGALWAGFVLLPGIGLRATTIFAAAINLALLGLVLAHGKRLETRQEAARRAETPQFVDMVPASTVLIIAAFAASGALSMIYEVGWTRALLMVIGSSTYAFTVMLSTFLIGIFSGSLIGAKFVDRAREPLSWFAILELAVCVCAMVALYQFNLLPWWNLQINAFVPDNPDVALFGRFVLAGSILLPLSTCIGATFPLAVRACAREVEKIGGTVGALYSGNTVGAIVGAIAAGFVFIPLFGVERTLLLAAAANYVLGIALLIPTKTIGKTIKIAAVVFCTVLVGWLVIRPGMWDRTVIAFAQPERRKLDEKLQFISREEFVRAMHRSGHVIFWRDGPSSNVSVWESADRTKHSFITNGHVDGSDSGDMPVQSLLAGFPMLFRPDAADVAVVGWGTGVSVGTVSRFPVKSITAIELEPAVIDASPLFHHVNYAPEEDPRVNIEFNDARNYLLATDKKFDVIISEPSNPWQAGVCNLFTSEFFKICRDCLKDGGVFSLWLQTSEVSPVNVRSILASLRSQFKYQLALSPCPANLVILASDAPLTLDLGRLKSMFQNKDIAATLARVGVNSPESVVSRLQADTAGLAQLVDRAPPNVDDTNHLEYSVGKTYESYSFGDKNQQMMDSVAIAPPYSVAVPATLSPERQAEALARVAEDALNNGNPKEALRWTNTSLAVKENTKALRVAGYAYLKMGNLAQACHWWSKALLLDPRDLDTLHLRCAAYLEFGDIERAKQDCDRMLAIDPRDDFVRYAMAERSVVLKEPGDVTLKILGNLPDDKTFVSTHHDVLYVAAAAYYRSGDAKKAQSLLEQYLRLEPQSVMGARLLGTVLFNRGETMPAAAWWARSLYTGMVQAEPMYQKASQLMKAGDELAAAEMLAEALDLYPDPGTHQSDAVALARRNQRIAQLLSQLKLIIPEK